MMAKRFKIKFTISPSFQMCRSKDLSSFPGNPVPAIYRLSPVNPKSHHTGYPNHLPAASPPPTSPEHRCKVSSKIKSNSHYGCQICRDKEIKKAKSRGRKSTSSVPSRRSEFLIDSVNEEESETLISCLTSFSDDEKVCYSGTASHSKTENKDLTNRINRRKISGVTKVQRVRFHSTLENGRGEKTTVMSNSACATSMTRSSMEEKVKESFAVVKKSKDPYEDFKKSMVEMIAEMEMSEAADLEQLLQCFLALNSRSYHAVIVRAFMEIWQEMFVWNPKSIKNLQTDIKTNMEK